MKLNKFIYTSGQRVDSKSIKIQDEYLDFDRV